MNVLDFVYNLVLRAFDFLLGRKSVTEYLLVSHTGLFFLHLLRVSFVLFRRHLVEIAFCQVPRRGHFVAWGHDVILSLSTPTGRIALRGNLKAKVFVNHL